jgi:hypothetical protein
LPSAASALVVKSVLSKYEIEAQADGFRVADFLIVLNVSCARPFTS